MLDNVCINRFLKVLSRNCSTFEFLYVDYLLYPDRNPPFEEELSGGQDVQIIGGCNEKHWRCIFFYGTRLYILNSVSRREFWSLPHEEQIYTQKRYPHLRLDKIVPINVTIQPDCYSCGCYAIANAVTLLNGQNPNVVRHSQNAILMRQHFLKVIVTGVVTPFPQ